ncbi:MAG: metallophosphoesterase [Phycisphaerales bacterium]|nr:metallophosphoesterase [Phycisphaerales bacterium]
MFWTVMWTVAGCAALWWLWAHLWVGSLPRARWWRAVLAAFSLAQIAALGWALAPTRVGVEMPTFVRAWVYIWNMLALPLGVILGVTCAVGWGVWRLTVLARRRPKLAPAPAPAQDGPSLTRRQLLAASAVAAPPVLSGVGLAKGLWELDSFRVRDITVPLAALPGDLDGATFAHVTDVHVGRYTRGAVLREIARRVNSLRCDAVLMTGDLIDRNLSDLPEALVMVARFDGPVYLCEGNHDLFESREGFAAGVRAAGFPLLRNEAATLRLRGVPVQLLGIRWGGPGRGRDASVEDHLREIENLRDPDAFQILLAHHPHAFDGAVRRGIPLTLGGHTHGGQLMLSDDAGAGPLLYRYWSGLYQSDGPDGPTGACVISNGVGNWFPLRLNAPAEVVRVTLRRA